VVLSGFYLSMLGAKNNLLRDMCSRVIRSAFTNYPSLGIMGRRLTYILGDNIMPTRSAKANWRGSIQEGRGAVQFGDFSEPYHFSGRFGDERIGVSPEELIAAAVSSCYNMALAVRLSHQGLTVEQLDTQAKVTISPSGVGFKISRILIETKGQVPGITAGDFRKHAEVARDTCPVVTALAAVITELKTEFVD
jgi:lipoyl-dependent peroxiredoxin